MQNSVIWCWWLIAGRFTWWIANADACVLFLCKRLFSFEGLNEINHGQMKLSISLKWEEKNVLINFDLFFHRKYDLNWHIPTMNFYFGPTVFLVETYWDEKVSDRNSLLTTLWHGLNLLWKWLQFRWHLVNPSLPPSHPFLFFLLSSLELCCAFLFSLCCFSHNSSCFFPNLLPSWVCSKILSKRGQNDGVIPFPVSNELRFCSCSLCRAGWWWGMMDLVAFALVLERFS